LPDRLQPQHQFRDADREQIMTARQAAEALFTPKPERTRQPVSEPSQVPEPRKPRILPVLAPASIRQEPPDTPVTSKAAAPEISTKRLARLRTLVKYGMKVSQVAEVYRLPVETIKQLLRKA
jgi:hypothetical protein